MLLNRLSRHKPSSISFSLTLLARRLHDVSDQTVSSSSSSRLRDHYSFQPPPPLSPSSKNPNPSQKKKSKPHYRPPSSLEGIKKMHSDLPFDFRFSYTESSSNVRPIGLREPKYSPFGPDRLNREWTGVCAPAVDPKVQSVEGVEDPKLEEKRRIVRGKIQGKSLTEAERKFLVELCQRNKTKRQINLGRDGLTHNMLNDIYNHWKHAEAVRVKCLGVPTIDMKNVIYHLEDKTYGQVISKHCGTLVLYRGRNYDPKKRPKIPLMLWKPHEPVYPRLIKTTIDGLSIEETKVMRKKGLAVPALTKLAKNGYYGSLVPMIRDAFLVSELVRIDCLGLEKKDYKKIGAKLRDLVPCILVTFDKEQVVIWRGKDYKQPKEEDDNWSFIHGDAVIQIGFSSDICNAPNVQLSMKQILGLDICKDSIVGDDMVRGISGGEKQRVPTGEMIVRLFMDEISTGLDSPISFQIVKWLQQIVHLTESHIANVSPPGCT